MFGKILVIGATGQLGSRLADNFSRLGWEVVCSSRAQIKSEYDQLHYLASETSNLDLDAILDCVGPRQQSLGQTSHLNNYGLGAHFEWISKLALNNPTAKVVRLSSCKIYDFASEARPHEGSPLDLKSYYGLAHQWAESHVEAIENSLVLRLSNSFGPPGKEGSLNHALLTNHVFEELSQFGKVKLSGNPQSVRNFFPVTLLTDAVNWALARDLTGIYNLGAAKSSTLEDWVAGLLRIWESVTGRTGSFQFVNSRANVNIEQVDIDKWTNTGYEDSSSEEDCLLDLARYVFRRSANE